MGKHKNSAQIAIFLQFMENNPDIAKGYTKRDKALVQSLWQNLADDLNAAGPPPKDVVGWKKVWTDWKSDIKKKLSHNKMEARATGGGPFSKHQLSNAEEDIMRLCGISQAVEGIYGVSLGLEEEAVESDNDIPSTSSKRRPDTPYTCNTPKKIRSENINQRLSKFLDEDDQRKKEMQEKLQELISIQKENGSSIRRIYRALEQGNERKEKQIELEVLKFEAGK